MVEFDVAYQRMKTNNEERKEETEGRIRGKRKWGKAAVKGVQEETSGTERKKKQEICKKKRKKRLD